VSNRTLTGVLASAVADAGTFAVSYPTGTDEGAFYGAFGHHIMVNSTKYAFPDDLDITLTTTTITVTNKSGATWPAGATWYLNLNQHGQDAAPMFSDAIGVHAKRTVKLANGLYLINMGAPDVLDADGVCESQNRTGAGVLLINGALSDGDLATSVATFDKPRNVIADSGGADTAVITVTGTDEYGAVMSEAITLNGTTAVAGKKAFKTVTGVSASATVTNGMFLGTGDVLGLPIALPETAFVLKEIEDGAAATAGTLVAALRTGGGSTTTTADVRGTYDPNSATDGDKVLQLIVAVPDLLKGVAQA
jgi:hypothetical protein